MKKVIFTFIALLFLIAANATIRRVNNNPGVVLNTAGPAFVYSSFSSAMTAAAVGDTIYLEPSDVNYGDISVTKRIVLIGPGYFLNKNPNSPFDKRSAKVSSLGINGELNASINASGSIVYGITVQNLSGIYGSVTIGAGSGSFGGIVKDVAIVSCIMSNLTRNSFGSSGVLIDKCFITGSISNLTSNSKVTNCIILGTVDCAPNNIISHNIIFSGIQQNDAFLFNNIVFPKVSPSLDFPTDSKVYNNVCVGCTGTPSFNNFFTTAANTIFQVAEPRVLDDLWDERFKLSTSSPAKTKGVSGIDCGVFAGTEPYVLSGIPPFPMITAFTQGAPSGGNIPITISIKRN